MWWLGLGILYFIWFFMNGDEFYQAIKERNIDTILLHLLLLLPMATIIYGVALAPFIEMLWRVLFVGY